MRLSARNQFKGEIVVVAKGQTNAHLRIDIGRSAMAEASNVRSRWSDMRLVNLTPAFLAAALLFAPASGRAENATACAKFKWPVAREQAAFVAADLPTAANGQSLPGVGHAANVSLEPQSSVTFAKAPGRKPKVDPAFAAVLSLPAITTAGRYQVTVSEDAWIDVLQNGKEVRSSGFSAQQDCPEIRKSVRFSLQPGPATVQISGVSADAVKIDVLTVE